MAVIWIVEDDPTIGLLIELTMKKDGHQAVLFPDAEAMEAERKESRALPDLMLLDLMLRAKNGFEVLTDWKMGRQTKNIPILIISARSAEPDKVKGLELGAEDYITKPFGVKELQARVRTALRRIPPSLPDELKKGDLTLLPRTRETFVKDTRVDLTAMEFDLLLFLARHPGATVTRDDLLREVWGYESDEDMSRTVDSHIKTLRLKLGDDARNPRFIQTVRGTGYRLIAGEKQ